MPVKPVLMIKFTSNLGTILQFCNAILQQIPISGLHYKNSGYIFTLLQI